MIKHGRLLWPLLALVALSIPFAVSNLDIRIESSFYDETSHSWKFAASPIVEIIYGYGTWPAWAGGVIALVIFGGSFAVRSLKPYRIAAIFFVAVIALGPGLLVNIVLKRGIGRPRPREIVEFGGGQKYLRLAHFDRGAHGHSFPSGHASMGFAWLGLGVFFAGRRRSASVAFFCAGIVHGSVMGLGRMMQGGHFPSDVLGSALVLYALSVALRMLFDAFNHRRGFSKTTADQGSVT